MDLAKVGEICVRKVHDPGDYEQVRISELLAQGWVLLSVKTVPNTDKDSQFLHSAVTIFVLGKPREKPRPKVDQRDEAIGPFPDKHGHTEML